MNVKISGRARHYRTVTFDAVRNEVCLIEQRLLPHQFKIVRARDFKETAAAKLMRGGMNLLTHGNAGWLAFVDVGSAAAPMYAAQQQGKDFHVFCDETRPRWQGATLAGWELAREGISHQVIADNAAGHLM